MNNIQPFRMPFGLTNASATFQRLIDFLSSPKFELRVFEFLEDTVLVFEDTESRRYWLERALTHLKEVCTYEDSLFGIAFRQRRTKTISGENSFHPQLLSTQNL